ncbi:MAG: HAD hydrolase family protein [Candidatus Omnitrophica bacterium]|nr:HAD hydrolase family protein [Candidatus Omnitrophota bacterium]MDD5080387.1 HAD hydrolase family protein [Candidatus Omnitrophota bacterium]MDD5440727.1 HAD hydrolase family protein [Candidatus Omnitrophota bacterium]
MQKEVFDKFKKVSMLVLDVDGVLTKGEMIYDDTGRELKIFNVKDGLGVYLLHLLGIKTILLSAGRSSEILLRRAKDMHAAEVIYGLLPKELGLDKITEKYKISKNEICFIGDDLIDVSVMKKVGVPVAVKDAVDEVIKIACYVTSREGGCGAVREIVDLIIEAKGLEAKRDAILADPEAM